MSPKHASTPYIGPVPVITARDAERLLPLLHGRPELDDLAHKLQTAANADPRWRQPVR